MESTSKLDYEEVSTPMSLSDPYSKLIYLFGTSYEGWIDSKFIFVHKDILVIMQGCIGVSEQGF